MTVSDSESPTDDPSAQPKWQPLTRLQRRVVGVLVEKSKTTPQSYPMTLNAIRVASNQKSNRSPQMDLDEDDVEDTLIELKEIGAVVEIHSGSRTLKYRHLLYEWFGVEKAELAVMCELLLRGAQTLGDLRARAGRMEKISGLDELKPIVKGLIEKGLMVEITPAGRGQIVTHNVYQPEELDKVRRVHGGGASAPASRPNTPTAAPPQPSDGIQTSSQQGTGQGENQPTAEMVNSQAEEKIEELQSEIKDLWETVRQLRTELDEIKS